MREETRRRFERQIYKRWFIRGGIGLFALLIVSFFIWFEGLDAHVEKRQVSGVVEKVAPVSGINTQFIQNGLAVDVKLDDGRIAHVLVLKTSNPEVGMHVLITEHIHGTGRSSYSWK